MKNSFCAEIISSCDMMPSLFVSRCLNASAACAAPMWNTLKKRGKRCGRCRIRRSAWVYDVRQGKRAIHIPRHKVSNMGE